MTNKSPDLDPIAQSVDSTPNRATDNKFEGQDASKIKVTFYQIDETIINYLNDTVAPVIVDNERAVPVPVIYASPERWKAIRKDGYLRDKKNDKMQTPLITIRRTSISRNPLTNPSNKYLYITHQARWNYRNAYDRFSVLNNITPSLETRNVIVPDFIDINYEIIAWTEYQEQMNDVIEQIHVENDEFWGLRNHYKFRVKIDDYTSNIELPATRERIVRNLFNMKVSAYLVPEKYIKNFSTTSTNSKAYTIKKVIAMTELDQTGTNNPDGVRYPSEIKRYYDRIKAIPEKDR